MNFTFGPRKKGDGIVCLRYRFLVGVVRMWWYWSELEVWCGNRVKVGVGVDAVWWRGGCGDGFGWGGLWWRHSGVRGCWACG